MGPQDNDSRWRAKVISLGSPISPSGAQHGIGCHGDGTGAEQKGVCDGHCRWKKAEFPLGAGVETLLCCPCSTVPTPPKSPGGLCWVLQLRLSSPLPKRPQSQRGPQGSRNTASAICRSRYTTNKRVTGSIVQKLSLDKSIYQV